MSYSYSRTSDGEYRLKVLMVDNKGTDIYEIFFTYAHLSFEESYDYPLPEAEPLLDYLGDTIGTRTEAVTHYFYVLTQNGKELLASWTRTAVYDVKINPDPDTYIIGEPAQLVYEVTNSSSSGHRISHVSNQITGNYMVHTYLYTSLTGDVERKVRVTNIVSGKVLNFTHEDLDITDTSPLDSNDERWRLLTAIGIYSADT